MSEKEKTGTIPMKAPPWISCHLIKASMALRR
jgi:hypothetical protein